MATFLRVFRNNPSQFLQLSDRGLALSARRQGAVQHHEKAREAGTAPPPAPSLSSFPQVQPLNSSTNTLSASRLIRPCPVLTVLLVIKADFTSNSAKVPVCTNILELLLILLIISQDQYVVCF